MKPSVEQMREAYEKCGQNYTRAARYLREQGYQCSRHMISRHLSKQTDPDVVIPEGHRLRGTSSLYRVTPDGLVKELVWMKTDLEEDGLKTFIEALKEEFEEYRGCSLTVDSPEHVETDLLTIYPIADLHFGMYAWAEETGADYDLKIAENLLNRSLSRLISSSPDSKMAVVLNLGDFFHADDSTARTPASGNVLDVDTRYFKVLRTGIKLMMMAIDMAKQKHEHVVVRCLPGNHDPETARAMTVALSLFYDNDSRVSIDDDPGEFWFLRWGKVMFGATHGHRVNARQLPTEMAVRRPEDWGRSVWRYGFVGHVHHRQKVPAEWGGVEVESLQTLAAKDAWHAGGPFHSNRAMVAITYHAEDGEVERHKVNVSVGGKLN